MGWERFDRGTKAPLGVAVARNELLVHRTRAELAVDYPELAAATRFGAWLSIPLSVAGKTIGAIGLSFAEGRTFRPADLEYVESLARQTGLALDRTLLLEDEQRARARAEQLASDLSRLHAFATALGAATSDLGGRHARLRAGQVDPRRERVRGLRPVRDRPVPAAPRRRLADPGPRPDARRPDVAVCLDAALNPPSSLWLATADDWSGAEPYGVLRTPDGLAVAVVPLAAGRAAVGAPRRVVLDGRVPGGERETAPGDDGAAGDAAARARAAARERAGGAARGADRGAADAHAARGRGADEPRGHAPRRGRGRPLVARRACSRPRPSRSSSSTRRAAGPSCSRRAPCGPHRSSASTPSS